MQIYKQTEELREGVEHSLGVPVHGDPPTEVWAIEERQKPLRGKVPVACKEPWEGEVEIVPEEW